MTKPILLAGLLGGLLGGVASFAAGRWIKPPEPAKSEDSAAPIPMTEAREVADAFVTKLRAGKYDEFAVDVKIGASMSDEEGKKFKERMAAFRVNAVALCGQSSGEFERLRETALSPSLFRFVYLEKLERSGVWWSFVLYRGKDNWKLTWVEFGVTLRDLFGSLS